MAKQSKRYKFMSQQVEDLGSVDVTEAVTKLKGLESGLPKEIKPCAFDQSVDVALVVVEVG